MHDMTPLTHGPVIMLVHGSDRFDPLTEESRLILIFPLFDGGQPALRAGWQLVNRCRLGPPESALSGRN